MKSRSQSFQMMWPYWKNQARKDAKYLLHSTTPSRRRGKKCACNFMYKTHSWVHCGRWRLGEQIALETGKDEVIKWQSQDEENEEEEIFAAVVTVTAEKRKSLVRKQLKWRPRNRSSISGSRMSFSFLESVQIGSGNNLTYFIMSPVIPSQDLRHLGREPDRWPASNTEVKYVRSLRNACLSCLLS
jgi:hypothetical protein